MQRNFNPPLRGRSVGAALPPNNAPRPTGAVMQQHRVDAHQIEQGVHMQHTRDANIRAGHEHVRHPRQLGANLQQINRRNGYDNVQTMADLNARPVPRNIQPQEIPRKRNDRDHDRQQLHQAYHDDDDQIEGRGRAREQQLAVAEQQRRARKQSCPMRIRLMIDELQPSAEERRIEAELQKLYDERRQATEALAQRKKDAVAHTEKASAHTEKALDSLKQQDNILASTREIDVEIDKKTKEHDREVQVREAKRDKILQDKEKEINMMIHDLQQQRDTLMYDSSIAPTARGVLGYVYNEEVFMPESSPWTPHLLQFFGSQQKVVRPAFQNLDTQTIHYYEDEPVIVKAPTSLTEQKEYIQNSGINITKELLHDVNYPITDKGEISRSSTTVPPSTIPMDVDEMPTSVLGTPTYASGGGSSPDNIGETRQQGGGHIPTAEELKIVRMRRLIDNRFWTFKINGLGKSKGFFVVLKGIPGLHRIDYETKDRERLSLYGCTFRKQWSKQLHQQRQEQRKRNAKINKNNSSGTITTNSPPADGWVDGWDEGQSVGYCMYSRCKRNSPVSEMEQRDLTNHICDKKWVPVKDCEYEYMDSLYYLVQQPDPKYDFVISVNCPLEEKRYGQISRAEYDAAKKHDGNGAASLDEWFVCDHLCPGSDSKAHVWRKYTGSSPPVDGPAWLYNYIWDNDGYLVQPQNMPGAAPQTLQQIFRHPENPETESLFFLGINNKRFEKVAPMSTEQKYYIDAMARDYPAADFYWMVVGHGGFGDSFLVAFARNAPTTECATAIAPIKGGSVEYQREFEDLARKGYRTCKMSSQDLDMVKNLIDNKVWFPIPDAKLQAAGRKTRSVFFTVSGGDSEKYQMIFRMIMGLPTPNGLTATVCEKQFFCPRGGDRWRYEKDLQTTVKHPQ
ncbi:unnamed protein product [Amoebophrya sp. A120]|nr:unnamed protein product [Amoebophrya sp. A120]|eukprot:GSA120T00019746001.1